MNTKCQSVPVAQTVAQVGPSKFVPNATSLVGVALAQDSVRMTAESEEIPGLPVMKCLGKLAVRVLADLARPLMPAAVA